LLGDAYEYLMRHFATESGKSKGQFYTPAEVSRILAKVVGLGRNTKQDQTVYDPTCGSGSLLLKVADEAPHGITIYGQEKDNATWALAKMNMILHGNEIADIRKGDTITSPQLQGQRCPAPHSSTSPSPTRPSPKSWSNGLNPANDYGRFEFGDSAREERRLRLPPAHPQVPEEHRQGGGHPAARRAVPGQRRSDIRKASSSSAATSRASSACPPTCSTAPASRLHHHAGQGERPAAPASS
jgi:hypothetical protein